MRLDLPAAPGHDAGPAVPGHFAAGRHRPGPNRHLDPARFPVARGGCSPGARLPTFPSRGPCLRRLPISSHPSRADGGFGVEANTPLDLPADEAHFWRWIRAVWVANTSDFSCPDNWHPAIHHAAVVRGGGPALPFPSRTEPPPRTTRFASMATSRSWSPCPLTEQSVRVTRPLPTAATPYFFPPLTRHRVRSASAASPTSMSFPGWSRTSQSVRATRLRTCGDHAHIEPAEHLAPDQGSTSARVGRGRSPPLLPESSATRSACPATGS